MIYAYRGRAQNQEAMMKDPKPTFADQAPPALGRFNSTRETLRDVKSNGWSASDLRAAHGYIGEAGAYPAVLFRERSALETTELRRRPCDGLSLQGPALSAFENKEPGYFPIPIKSIGS